MKRLLAAAAALLALGLGGCAYPQGDASPNQPCPAAVRECHVVNCLVTPTRAVCPHREPPAERRAHGVHVEICPPYCGERHS